MSENPVDFLVLNADSLQRLFLHFFFFVWMQILVQTNNSYWKGKSLGFLGEDFNDLGWGMWSIGIDFQM